MVRYVLLRVPDPTGVYLRRPRRHGLYRVPAGPLQPSDGDRGGRRRRAAAEDIWRGPCQYGGDCPEDVKNRFTQNTLADRLLKWLGSALFLGGLSIGTGGGARAGAGAAAEAGAGGGVAWPGINPGPGRPDSFIPLEKPFVLPGSDIPVRVDTGTLETLRPIDTTDAPNTFVNPVYEGDTVSIAASDNVVIADVVPAPAPRPVPEPLPDAPDLEFPDDGPRTRGDTFVTEDMLVAGELPDAPNPFVPHRMSDPDPVQPFVGIELQTVPRPPPFSDGYTSTSFGGDADWGFQELDVPDTSTPLPGRGGPRATVQFANPVYDALYVDEVYNRDLAETAAAAFSAPEPGDAVAALSTPIVRGRGPRITVTQLLRQAGMRLRSGRMVPYTVRLLGDISPITLPAEPDSIQLRSYTPTGFGDAFVGDFGISEHSLSHAPTLPWDGRPIDITDVVSAEAPFVDIPLDDDDPFPEMEIIDDTDTDAPRATAPIRPGAQGSVWALGNHSTARPTSGGIHIYGPGADVLPPPDRPGVVVSYYGYGTVWDPSLYWPFFYKRRRLHRLFYR
ncbi:L2 [Puffin papillomavirus 1]|uniref:L2 n=1 Tax=Puffin papillomavirus 1 TaxID=2562557 RepID=A0AAE5YMD7_9PAPI|nr:L2 [Puffin papillomavirus 1]